MMIVLNNLSVGKIWLTSLTSPTMTRWRIAAPWSAGRNIASLNIWRLHIVEKARICTKPGESLQDISHENESTPKTQFLDNHPEQDQQIKCQESILRK